MISLRWLSLFVILANANLALGYPFCHNQGSLEEQAALLHRATRIGRENRRPIPKAMEKKFAGTGLIVCGNDTVTAQVTGSANVITTAGHVFSTDDCQPKNREKCHFERTINGRIKEFRLNIKSLKTGGPCPSGERMTDWAVIKLEDPMPDVSPYEIPDEDNLLKEGENILQITGMSVDYSVNGALPKAMEMCRAEKIDLTALAPVKHSCDTGGASSGSAQFVKRGDKMIFAAMNVAEHGHLPPGSGFDEEMNYNTSTPVTGRFLKAIREAMKP